MANNPVDPRKRWFKQMLDNTITLFADEKCPECGTMGVYRVEDNFFCSDKDCISDEKPLEKRKLREALVSMRSFESISTNESSRL